jgi:hypothetical protein
MPVDRRYLYVWGVGIGRVLVNGLRREDVMTFSGSEAQRYNVIERIHSDD